ncbi:MAG: hypothetical protein KJP21_05245 [Bacteroidia bacterium]|nr:hypothetical protein [Bacteroidia bacterium]NNJ56404.1 hypothetical protein [Bacteroidia bacterium]
MKRYLITLIYSTLAILIVAYLFRIMLWDGSKDLLWAGFWMHIATYIGYSLLVKEKDNRMMYPLMILVLVVLLGNFDFNLPIMVANAIGLVIMFAYVAFHLFVPNYLDKTTVPKLNTVSIIVLVICALAIAFKLLKFPMVDVLLLVGCSSLALLVLITGVTKGLTPKSKT